MISRDIILRNPEEMIEFVNLVEAFSYSIDVLVGNYVIDAKSILGMFGLGVAHVMKMDVHAEKADDLLVAIDRFVYNNHMNNITEGR